jgi:ketosteroid isomerase-like protein
MALTEEEMIEALRRTNDALNRGDFDAAIELAAPDIVYVRPGSLPALHGPDAIRAWMEPDAFESQETELLEFEPVGRSVLTRQHTTARGAGSGIEMELDSVAVWTFNEDGMLIRVQTYTLDEEDDARQALEG